MTKVYLVITIKEKRNGDEENELINILYSKEEAVKYSNKYIRNTVRKYGRWTDKTLKYLDPYEPDLNDSCDYFVRWSTNIRKLEYSDLDLGYEFVTYSHREKGNKGEPEYIKESIRIIESHMIEYNGKRFLQEET